MTSIDSALSSQLPSSLVKAFMDDLFLMSSSLSKLQELLHCASLALPWARMSVKASKSKRLVIVSGKIVQNKSLCMAADLNHQTILRLTQNNSGYSNINTNLSNLLGQINNATDNDNSEDDNLPNCKYWDISYFTNHITKGMKSKALLLLFHLNVASLPKQFDNFKYLINSTMNLIL